MHKLVLVRHGESLWNKENRFTGWEDIDLTDKGLVEAKTAGQLLKQEKFHFDQVYTSVLKRAIRSLWSILSEMDQMWLPVYKEWRLNERHYGNLQGLNKKETAEKFGEEQVFTWRRSYDVPPPAMEESDKCHPRHDPRYKNLTSKQIPSCEALKQTKDRVLPFWEDTIAPQIRENKSVLIVAHGNSLRALVKHLDQVSDEDIMNLNIPTGIPLIYELDKNLKPIESYYLLSPSKQLKKSH